MRYICLGFMDVKQWEAMSEADRSEMMDACFAYDEELIRNGHNVGGHALHGPETAATVRKVEGEIRVTDGPFVETKEQLGGFLLIDVPDLNDAIRVAAQFPAARFGSVEVRPVKEHGCA